MSKEYLEALEVICGELVETDLLFIDRNGENQEKWRKSEAFAKLKEFDKKYGSPVTVLQNALQRLEAIDNSNPSEALECLEKIIDNLDDYADFEIKQEANEYIDTIKQALLKAQEQEKELEGYKKLNLSLLKQVLENGVWVKGEHNNFYHLSPTDMNVVIKDDWFVIQELYFEDLDCVMDTTGFELHSSEYKKKFWLKEDKSE